MRQPYYNKLYFSIKCWKFKANIKKIQQPKVLKVKKYIVKGPQNNLSSELKDLESHIGNSINNCVVDRSNNPPASAWTLRPLQPQRQQQTQTPRLSIQAHAEAA